MNRRAWCEAHSFSSRRQGDRRWSFEVLTQISNINQVLTEAGNPLIFFHNFETALYTYIIIELDDYIIIQLYNYTTIKLYNYIII